MDWWRVAVLACELVVEFGYSTERDKETNKTITNPPLKPTAFCDLNISSPRTPEDSAKAVPGDPFPLDGARASRALRIQQLSLWEMDSLWVLYLPNPPLLTGTWVLSLSSPSCSDQLPLTVPPEETFSSIKAEFTNDEMEVSTFKDVVKHVMDKSLYSFGLCAQLLLSPSSSIQLSTEGNVVRFNVLPGVCSCQAAWPELFVDHKGKYWDLPESMSLDMSSLVSGSGLWYRIGLPKNIQAVNSVDGEAPTSLMPGFCAKAAFSYEKSQDLWRQNETRKDIMIQKEKGWFWRPSYDVRHKEPHSSVSGIFVVFYFNIKPSICNEYVTSFHLFRGCRSCTAWFQDGYNPVAVDMKGDEDNSRSNKKRNPFSADFFGSLCCTFQHGKFRELYGDLTRIDSRLDICSASALAKRFINGLKSSSANSAKDPMSSPRINLIFQQQIYGPIVFRADSRVALDCVSIVSHPLEG
ncbi:hypothetical protein COP2_041505 [Malus domestica]